jgi:hypothetical protein
MTQSEISLCRVYKRSGIDGGHVQPSSSNQASSGRRTRTTGRHVSTSPASTPLSQIQHPRSFHLLQGDCSSASPPAIMDQVITAHNVPQLLQSPRPLAFPAPQNSLVAVAPTEGATILASSTYSLLNMAAVPMGSSRTVDELSTPVGHNQAYENHLSAAIGSHFLTLPMLPPSPQPTPQVAPLGAPPMAAPLASVTDKLSWDWNPVPDTTARDYNTSSFK